MSHSHSECINELTLGVHVCSNNPNDILLAIPMAKKSSKSSSFKTKNSQKDSGQYGAIKLRIKAISVIAKVLSYHLRHHSVCLCKNLHV